MQYSQALELLAPLPAGPHPKMTERYAFIDTRSVLSDMYDLGYELKEFSRPKARTDVGNYAVHELSFMKRDVQAYRGEAPRVIFMNSYNGSLSARILSGLIRFACSNGIVIGEGIQKARFIHIGDYEDQLLSHLQEADANVAKVYARTDRFKTITLDPSQYYELAQNAARLRFNEDSAWKLDPQMLLQPRRLEDMRSDLWTTWNRIQENVIRGGVLAEDAEGRVMEVREVTAIGHRAQINRGLWDLLEAAAEAA